MNFAEAGHLLRLSDVQLAVVRRAAASLRPAGCERFMKIVASELAEAERVDDAAVAAVVETVLATIVDR